MKRVFWFSTGVATGFGGALYGYVRLRREAGRWQADRLAGTLADVARGGFGAARDLLDDAREAVHEAEAELRGGVEADEASPARPPGPRRLPRPARRGARHPQTQHQR